MRPFLVLLLYLWPLAAGAADPPTPTIERLSATASGGKVSVRFTLDGLFRSGEMVEALRSGLPTSITYVIEIFRDRPNWFDDSVGEARLEVICTYNSLTREYLVNYRRDRKLVRSETFTDATALQRAMSEVSEVDLFDVSGRRKPWKLKVRVKADLMRGWLAYVIPWEVSTPWRESRVRTAAE